MSKEGILALVGEVLVDVTLGKDGEEHKMRLGGVVHAARAAWALGQPYETFFIAPSYLIKDIEQYLYAHDCLYCECIAIIQDSSNVILIGNAKELYNQEYSILKSDRHSSPIAKFVLNSKTNKVLIFPGSYDLAHLLVYLNVSNHKVDFYIDISNDLHNISILGKLGRKFKCIFDSMSIDLMNRSNLLNLTYSPFEYCEAYLIKENRGGGVLRRSTGEVIRYPCFIRQISHSVGVGDCFNVIFSAEDGRKSDERVLRKSSFLSAEYAATSFPDEFKLAFETVTKSEGFLDSLLGIDVPWSSRPNFKIYIAAPDFDWVDDTEIRKLERALLYHNFHPLLPVKINGQIGDFEDIDAVSQVFNKDIILIKECDLLIGVVIYDDPGTLIEIGYAKGLDKRVIVYDPNCRAKNPMLTCLPDFISTNLESVINEVFKYASD